MSEISQPMTKEQLLQQIGRLIRKYEEENNETVVGAFIQPTMSNDTEVYQWNGEEFCEEKCKITIEEVEGSAEFYAAKEEKIRNDLISEGWMKPI